MASFCSSLFSATPGQLLRSNRKSVSRGASQTACVCRQQAEGSRGPTEQQRRDLLLAGAGLCASLAWSGPAAAAEQTPAQEIAGKKVKIEVANLTNFQKADQRKATQNRAERALREVLSREDATVALRAVLHDAASYNASSNTGGVNGSIVFDDELKRPENKDLRPYIDKLRGVKKQIDEQSVAAGQGKYSWADVLVLAAKVTAQKSWALIKNEKSGLKGGETIASIYGAEFNVKLGRQDATQADPPSRIPSSDASAEQIQEFMVALANPEKSTSSGFLSILQPKPIFWEQPTFLLWSGAQKDPEAAEQKFVQSSNKYKGFKTDYDRSRNSVTRTNYEVDFVTFFNQLANLGANFNKDAYLVAIDTIAPRL